MLRDTMYIIHYLHGTGEYLMIDSLEDVVRIGGGTYSECIVDVARAKGFGRDECIGAADVEFREDGFEIVCCHDEMKKMHPTWQHFRGYRKMNGAYETRFTERLELWILWK